MSGRYFARMLCSWRSGTKWVIALGLICGQAPAQIRTDGSLGAAAKNLTGPNYVIPETMGKLSGANLFHSFQSFNINSGESANFTTSSAGVANVISRVTGGNVSQINGKLSLSAASGAPNFFFINPAGVTFGSGAAIDVPGAFHVSTANYLKFPDGNFYADTTHGSSFSSAAPEAFGFLGTTRGTILIRSQSEGEWPTLATKGQAFSLTAGDIEIDSAKVVSNGGELRMAALGSSAQEVKLSGALQATYGRLDIANGATISASGIGAINGGKIAVSAGDITIGTHDKASRSGIFSEAQDGTGDAGNIEIEASGKLTLIKGSRISSSTLTAGSAGSVTINAANILIDGESVLTGIFSNAEGSAGNAGSVDVRTSGNLTVLRSGAIASTTVSDGAAGSVKISADNITIDGRGIETGIFSVAIGKSSNAGSLQVNAGNMLTLINGGRISSTTYSAGTAGSVKVDAGSILIDGQKNSATGIASDSIGASGNAGNVTITARRDLTILGGGQISSSSRGTGAAGSLKINAADILIDGQGTSRETGIFSSLGSQGIGDTGTVDVTVSGHLSIFNGGQISSATDSYSSGSAGSVKVSAGSIDVDGQANGKALTGIFSTAHASDHDYYSSSGNAGNVDVSVSGKLNILNGGQISSSTYFIGNAGTVLVRAGDINIDSSGSTRFTGISSQANLDPDPSSRNIYASKGNAGNVDVTASGALNIVNGGQISSSTFVAGNAGSVRVNAAEINMDGHGSGGFTGISSQANQGSSGHAGDVTVTSTGQVSLFGGSKISSSTYGAGDAGAVQVFANDIVMDGHGVATGIFSEAGAGSGGAAGNVQVSAVRNLSLANAAQIGSPTGSSGGAGFVNVNATDISIHGQGSGSFTGISSQANGGSSGNAGDVSVAASGTLSLFNGGMISSSTYGTGNAGSVRVTADRIAMDGRGNATGIFSESGTAEAGRAGYVIVAAAGNLSLLNGAQIGSPTASAGNAGSVQVSAADISIDGLGGAGFTGISSQAHAGSTGDAGDVAVTARGKLSLSNGATISSSTYGAGNAGAVTVAADRIAIDGKGRTTGIFTEAGPGSAGRAGSVEVRASGNLSLLNGAQIGSPTASAGNAGSVRVSAAEIGIDGGGNAAFTGISSQANAGSSGDAGDVMVIASGKLSILDGGKISSSTYGVGNAGSVKVRAASVAIDGKGRAGGIFTEAGAGSAGRAGSVEVAATGNLSLLNGAQIGSPTTAAGNAGSVRVSAADINIDGWGSAHFTGISSQANAGSAGDAGDVVVEAGGTLAMSNGGAISSSAYGLGKAGSVHVMAQRIAMHSTASIASLAASGSSGQTGNVTVFAAKEISLAGGAKLSIQNDATARAGSNPAPALLTVSAPDVTLTDGATITSAATGNVSASGIRVHAGRRLAMAGSSIATSAQNGNGGAIYIDGGNLIDLENSQITTSVKGLTGNGGDITLRTHRLMMSTAFIQANTAASNASGGNVAIDVDFLVPTGNSLFLGGASPYTFKAGVFGFNVIQAAAPTGVSGTIDLTTPPLDVSSSLVGLNTQMIDAGGLGRSPCQVSRGSSLSQSGRGGFPPSSSDLLGPRYMPGAAGRNTSPPFASEIGKFLIGWECIKG